MIMAADRTGYLVKLADYINGWHGHKQYYTVHKCNLHSQPVGCTLYIACQCYHHFIKENTLLALEGGVLSNYIPSLYNG